MILLVDVQPVVGSRSGVRCVDALPPIHNQSYTPACVACVRKVALEEGVTWIREVRSRRPQLPIGLVARICDSLARDLIERDLRVQPVIDPSSIPAGLPESVLEELFRRSVVPAIINRLEATHGHASPELRSTLEVIAAAAAVGTRSGTALKRAGFGRSGVHRTLMKAGWPSAGTLWSAARLLSVDLRVGAGIDPVDALGAAGWRSTKDYRKAAKRLHGSSPRH